MIFPEKMKLYLFASEPMTILGPNLINGCSCYGHSSVFNFQLIEFGRKDSYSHFSLRLLCMLLY